MVAKLTCGGSCRRFFLARLHHPTAQACAAGAPAHTPPRKRARRGPRPRTPPRKRARRGPRPRADKHLSRETPLRGGQGKIRATRVRGYETASTYYSPIGSPGTAAEPGASQANILRAHKLLNILSGLAYVDMNRVAAHGNSMGAYVTTVLEIGRAHV